MLVPWTLFYSYVVFRNDLIGISQEVYQAAFRDVSDSEWRYILCEHLNAKSAMGPMEYVSFPDAESTQVDDMSHCSIAQKNPHFRT